MEEIQINTVFQNRVFMRFFIGESRNKLHKKTPDVSSAFRHRINTKCA